MFGNSGNHISGAVRCDATVRTNRDLPDVDGDRHGNSSQATRKGKQEAVLIGSQRVQVESRSLCDCLAGVYRHSIRGCRSSESCKDLHHKSDANLVETLGGRHGSLDGQASNVLPALLQQGDEVVDGQHDVADQLLLVHADVANGDTHAEHLLQLELDGGLDLGDLVGKVVGVGDGGGELAGCRFLRLECGVLRTLGQTRTQETGNLLDQGVGSDEGIVLASKLLDELLVLVQLLQVVGGHGVNTAVLGTIDIVLVTQDADGHVGARHGGQLDGAGETLVTLRVIVLEADLELDSLQKVPLFLGRPVVFVVVSKFVRNEERLVEVRLVGVAPTASKGGVLTSTRGARRRSGALRRP
ncbi:hypothetical protein FJTKL_09077 [Diaporthe vaccinii]|uniref:Uncharacterized protein n=1 Tax=Diaporthe vaccinii TaxID=105482 RepID=A0ABR4EQ11_9PEZI